MKPAFVAMLLVCLILCSSMLEMSMAAGYGMLQAQLVVLLLY
jgi:hypothetical protein